MKGLPLKRVRLGDGDLRPRDVRVWVWELWGLGLITRVCVRAMMWFKGFKDYAQGLWASIGLETWGLRI